ASTTTACAARAIAAAITPRLGVSTTGSGVVAVTGRTVTDRRGRRPAGFASVTVVAGGWAGRKGGSFRTVWDRLSRQPRPRPWTAVVAWPLAAGAAALALVRLIGLDSIAPLVQLIAFTPYLVVACAVAAALTG